MDWVVFFGSGYIVGNDALGPRAEVGDLVGWIFGVAGGWSVRILAARDPGQPAPGTHHALQHGRQADDGPALDVFGGHALGGQLVAAVADVEARAAHQEDDGALVVVLAQRDVHRRLADVVDGVDVAAGVEEALAGRHGSGERGPVERDVSLGVRDEGVGAALQQILDDRVVLVLAGPHQGRPPALVLHVDEVPRQVRLVQDEVHALEVAVLGRQVQARHAVVALQSEVGARLEEVPRHVRPPLDAREHQRRVLLVVEGVQLGAGLDEDVGGEGVALRGGDVERGAAVGLGEALVGRVTETEQLQQLHVVRRLDRHVHVASGVLQRLAVIQDGEDLLQGLVFDALRESLRADDGAVRQLVRDDILALEDEVALLQPVLREGHPGRRLQEVERGGAHGQPQLHRERVVHGHAVRALALRDPAHRDRRRP